MATATSHNGWPVFESGSDSALVSIPLITGRVRGGDVATILSYIVNQFNEKVEPIRKDWSWGYAYRPIRGATSGFSNHASATAVDINAPKHPMGEANTFTPEQVNTLRKILLPMKDVIRWGGDYRVRKDDMHFEINVPPSSPRVKEVADLIRRGAISATGPGLPSAGVTTPAPVLKTNSTVLTLQRLQKAASVNDLTGTDYAHRSQALASLRALGMIDRVTPKTGETWVSLFKTAWANWQKALGYTGSDADGVPGATSVYALARRVGLAYWDSVKQVNAAPIIPLPPTNDGTDRHIPSTYPYSSVLSTAVLKKAASTEVLTGSDYNQRLQALASLTALDIAPRKVPNQGEKWVTLFKNSWKSWQTKLGYTGSDADGVPGDASVQALAKRVGLKFASSTPPAPLPAVSDGVDRSIPSKYPYTETLTLQRLQKAATTEVLTGMDYLHRLQAMTSLKALGMTNRKVPATGEKWVPTFKAAWKNWQVKLGYSGSDADGIPGEASVSALAKRVGLKYWNAATSSGVAASSGSGASSTSKTNPTDHGRITTPFGKRPNNNTYWRAFGRHTGADFGRSSAKSTAIYAVHSGTITYRWDRVLGHIAILKSDALAGKTHQYFWYAHLASRPTTGRVTKGQKIGTMGQTGTGAAGIHLHLELLRSGTRWGTTWSDFTDPTPYVGQG